MDRIEKVMTIGSAVAMGLVIGLHLPSRSEWWICRCGVPWFFFASGFWFARESSGAGVRKRVRTLLVPYYLANLLWFPILLAANWIGWRHCGAERVIDASAPCVVRCLGLSPFAWPALVPTWFLRALFAVVVVSGGLKCFVGVRVLALAAWLVYGTQVWWMPSGGLWSGFFTYGLSLSGLAWFSTGLLVSTSLPAHGSEGRPSPLVSGIRRHLMPVYMLHAVVIVSIGWVAKACGCFGRLATVAGDVAMWVVGVLGAILFGELLRRLAPRLTRFLFGGR